MPNMSPSFSLDKADALHILKVAGWSVASTIVAALISLIPFIHFPAQWLWVVPVVNTILIAIQRFVTDHSQS